MPPDHIPQPVFPVLWPTGDRDKVGVAAESFYWRASYRQEGQGALFTSGAGLLDPRKDFSVSPASRGLAYKSYENPQAGSHGQSCPHQERKRSCFGKSSQLPVGVGHGQPRALPKEPGVVRDGDTNARSRWSSPRHQPNKAS